MTKAKSTALAPCILTSSIWLEPSDIRVVWITLLALANKDGKVKTTIKKIAEVANVSLEAATLAVQVFSSPDERSRDEENKGKRIEIVEDGIKILNFNKYNGSFIKLEKKPISSGISLSYTAVQTIKYAWYKEYRTDLPDIRIRKELNQLGNEPELEVCKAFAAYIKKTPAMYFSWVKFRDTWRNWLFVNQDPEKIFSDILASPTGRSPVTGQFWSMQDIRNKFGEKAATTLETIGGVGRLASITTANKPFITKEFQKAYGN